MAYHIDKTEEENIIMFLRGNHQKGMVRCSLTFHGKTDSKCIVKWIADNFYTSKIFCKHMMDIPYGFIICTHAIYTIEISRNTITAVLDHDNKLPIQLDGVSYTDFWKCCGFTAMQLAGNPIVQTAYKGYEMYASLFFNNYDIHHDLIAFILKDVVEKRNYVEENGTWIDMDEFTDRSTYNVKIHGRKCNKDDVHFLVFTALVADALTRHNTVISLENITCVAEGHFRDNRNDYIITDDIIEIKPIDTHIKGSINLWLHYGPRLYEKMICIHHI